LDSLITNSRYLDNLAEYLKKNPCLVYFKWQVVLWSGCKSPWNTTPGKINLAGGGSFRPVVFESERDFMPELPRRKGLTYPKPHRHCFPKTIFLAHEPFITSKESFNLKYSFHLIWNYWGTRHQNLILMGKYLRHCAKEIFSQTNYSKLVFL
jgi:hypothetical protein